MEIKSKTIKDILKVTFSNACILLSGILVGFLLPKIIDQVDYGYNLLFDTPCTNNCYFNKTGLEPCIDCCNIAYTHCIHCTIFLVKKLADARIKK